jgi:hypothetical protein
MEIGTPIWHLKRICPICEQGSSLAFISCPNCGYLAIQCEEEGTIFINPKDISSSGASNRDLNEIKCPKCDSKLSEYKTATSQEIIGQGYSKKDYE